MAFNPRVFRKGNRTETADSYAEETNLLFDGWTPDPSTPPAADPHRHVEVGEIATLPELRAAYDAVLPAPTGGDDTAVLQAAINAAPTGARLLAPRGAAYSVTALTVGVRVTLDFTAATVTQRAGTAADLLIINAAGVTVRGGTWDGNVTNQTTTNNAIRANADDVTVEAVTVQNVKFIGIYNTGGNRFRAHRCKVTNTGYLGIFAEPNTSTPVSFFDVAIADCFVDRSMLSAASISEGGIKVKGNSAAILLYRARVSGCTVLMPTSPADGTAIAIEATYAPGVLVTGCQVDSGAMGISVAACDRATVSNNPRIYNAATYGIEAAGCFKATVLGNTVDGNSRTTVGIMLSQGGGNNSDGTSVGANAVRGCTSNGIRVNSALRTAISGNSIEGAAGYLLYLSVADGAAVSGNAIDGLGTAAKGIMLDSTSHVTISGNAVRNTTESGVLAYSAQAGYTVNRLAITGNILESGNPVDAQLSNGAVMGSNVKVWGNTDYPDFLDFGHGVRQITSTGSPNGAWNGGVGSTYTQQDGEAGGVLWVKESGSGNTGWVAK